jgi:hypothetical protein
VDRRRRQVVIEEKIDDPNSTIEDNDSMWDDPWTGTTSDVDK